MSVSFNKDSFAFLRQAPFVKIVVPFAIGIFQYNVLSDKLVLFQIAIGIIAVLFWFLFQFSSDYFKFKQPHWRGIALFLIFSVTGYLLSFFHHIAQQKNWYVSHQKEFRFAKVRIASEMEAKPKTYKATVQVVALMNDSNAIATQGLAYLYFPKNDTLLNLKVGECLLIPNQFNNIVSARNPGAFNYAQYSQRNQVYQSAFLRVGQWKILNEHQNSIQQKFIAANQWTRNQLKKYITDSSSIGLAEALLIGYRKDMDEGLNKAYSNAGIVHIVAISGMHVALVYNVLKWLLFIIPFFKKRPRLTLSIAIMSMWLFATVTGLPASVTRAAVMLTFIAFGEIIIRKMSIYNNLAISAFILLAYNPTWLFDVGFQLSYLAVLSLVLFYQPIYNWLYVSNKILNFFWQLTAVTLAAQILTLPLCIFYFHQFPLLFIVSNLIAIPITTVIIFAEIGLLFLSPFPLLAKPLGFGISKTIGLLNFFVEKISQSNWATLGHMQIDVWQTLLMFIFILCMALWLMRQIHFAFLGSLSCLLILMISFIYTRYQTIQQQHLYVFETPKISTLAFVKGETAIAYHADSLAKNVSLHKYVLEPAFNFLHTRLQPNSNYEQSMPIEAFALREKRVARVFDGHFHLAKKETFDVLILTQKVKPDANWLSSNFNAAQLVLDGSVPKWKAKQWDSIAQTLHIPLHNTLHDGAFVKEY